MHDHHLRGSWLVVSLRASPLPRPRRSKCREYTRSSQHRPFIYSTYTILILINDTDQTRGDLSGACLRRTVDQPAIASHRSYASSGIHYECLEDASFWSQDFVRYIAVHRGAHVLSIKTGSLG
ncbi:hypothetical protein BDR03DRAFT_106512 [Suillus americanus]|nr:hypothetical protein BDR03DRAFT_106512 [Suillus americanus]